MPPPAPPESLEAIKPENAEVSLKLCPKEVEIHTAEIENRNRATILHIIRPTLSQVTSLLSRVDDLSEKVQAHSAELHTVNALRQEVTVRGGVVEVLSDEVAKLGIQFRALDTSTSTEISEMKSKRHEMNEKISSQKGAIGKVERESERISEDLDAVRSLFEVGLRKVSERIDANQRRAELSKDELAQMLRERDERREELMEELYGDGKGLVKLAAEIQAVTRYVEPLPHIEQELLRIDEANGNLARRMADTEGNCRDVKAGVEANKKRLFERFSEQDANFKRLANELTAYHASLMRDIRADYAAEINSQKGLRAELLAHQGHTESFCEETAEELKTIKGRVDAVFREMREDVEDAHRRRKKDRVTFEDEIKEVRRDVFSQQDLARTVHETIDFLSRVLGLSLEAGRLQSAIGIQDFGDRRGERWLSMPDEQGRKAAPPLTAEILATKRRPAGNQIAKRNPGIAEVNWRQGLVKNEYTPGSVLFSGRDFDRQDALLLHFQLLQQAHSAWERGPPRVAAVAANQPQPTTCGQPGASGGTAAAVAAPARPKAGAGASGACDAGDFTPRLGSAAHRQRPGSQGQPQGTGSRGTAFGTLGEVAPPPGCAPLESLAAGHGGPIRLPAIRAEGANLDDRTPRRCLTAR